MKTINKTTLFLILTFVFSFSIALFFGLLGGTGTGTVGFTLLGIVYMFIPTVSVIIVKKMIHKENIKDDLFVSFKINKWFLVAWFLMPIIMFSTLGINLLFPNVTYNPEMTGLLDRLKGLLPPDQIELALQSLKSFPINPILLILIQGLIAGVTVNALAAFGEELGWRGFLLQSFKKMKFYKVSIIIGFIWGIWHAPLILMGHNYPQHPQIGVLMMILFCILLTPLFLYITIKSKSVIAAAIMHGTMNAVAGITIMPINGGNDLTSGIAGFAGFLTVTIFLLVLYVYDHFISKDKIITNRISDYI